MSEGQQRIDRVGDKLELRSRTHELTIHSSSTWLNRSWGRLANRTLLQARDKLCQDRGGMLSSSPQLINNTLPYSDSDKAVDFEYTLQEPRTHTADN